MHSFRVSPVAGSIDGIDRASGAGQTRIVESERADTLGRVQCGGVIADDRG